MSRFRFVSRLPGGFREDLEAMLYFNPGQHRVSREANRVIEGFGPPEVQEVDGFLRVDIQRLPGAQCLFVLDSGEREALAGLVIFFRQDEEVLQVPHLVVSERYSTGGDRAPERLVSRIVGKILEIARMLRGVRVVELAYRQGLAVPVRNGR